ncbi:8-oxo-dGTP diphosphatase [Paenibacillus pinisoli]|uniref:8-oxo-dGTP diphosphatase n=1 Tax=Paenibacillus pinisoli TaxID=1276110 RepID=A0A3A6PKR9_9BACL|nr:8-oxo-dGTP diphosphatase [Paenibacillus pinisoli]RJX39888.1 8-oxo-dGTP diphosphatase [Paenibacillus pinisoli]
MYPYTICFIKRGHNLLLLNREKAPTKGLWNGVGGKFEPGESPLACVLRETFEETGIKLADAHYRGVVSWESDGISRGGMYVFVAELPEDYVYPTPLKISEGILDWKAIDWILSERNLGIGEMIPYYLPAILRGECLEHRCTFSNHKLTGYTAVSLSVEVLGS